MSLDFVIEMAWKSLVISGIAYVAFHLLASRSSADRAAMLRLTMALLVLLPFVSTLMPSLIVERPAPVRIEEIAPPIGVWTPSVSKSAMWMDVEAPAALREEAPPALSPEQAIVLGYAAGLLLVLARLLAGLWTLRRWTAAARDVASPVWITAFRRALANSGHATPTRLRVSDSARSPLSWGYRRPVILIDRDSLARPDDAAAILAHEIAHLTRRDWPALMLSRLAVALFWFNPLVWLLERALIEEAEEAADLQALGLVEPVSYAQSLVACFRQASGSAVPANSISSGNGLSRRIRAILDATRRGTPSGSLWTLGAMAACAAAAAPVAALKLVPAALPVITDESAPLPPATALATSAAPAIAALSAVPPLRAMVEAAAEPEALADPDDAVPPLPPRAPSPISAAPFAPYPPVASPTPPTPPTPQVARVAPTPPTPRVPPTPPTPPAAVIAIEDLVSMKTHGLRAAEIEQLVAVSARYRKLTPQQLIGLRAHGITAAKVRALADVGLRDLDVAQLKAMTVHGVSPEFIRKVTALGRRGLTPAQLVNLRIRGDIGAAASAAASAAARVSVSVGAHRSLQRIRIDPPIVDVDVDLDD